MEGSKLPPSVFFVLTLISHRTDNLKKFNLRAANFTQPEAPALRTARIDRNSGAASDIQPTLNRRLLALRLPRMDYEWRIPNGTRTQMRPVKWLSARKQPRRLRFSAIAGLPQSKRCFPLVSSAKGEFADT